MATAAQITANRISAQRSTGPKSEEGKARSAMNAFQSGLYAQSQLLPGESPEAFRKLQDEFYRHYQPAAPEERFYLDSAIRNEWLIRRFHNVEAQLWIVAAKKSEQ